MKAINSENAQGYFMNIQNFSVNDGDGIRTTVFMAGCPLRCKWCSNPEGFTMETNKFVSKEKLDDVLKIIGRQRIFYKNSGGGVTFSGGEATMQLSALRYLVNSLYDQGINLAIESSGYFDFEEVKDVLLKMDLIFLDIKHMDKDKHIKYTGVNNKLILENIAKIGKLNIPVVIRIPLILDVNADKENIINTAKFVKKNIKNPKIEFLPYHSFGNEKYEALGMKKLPEEFSAPTLEILKELEGLVESEGVEIVNYK